MKRLQQARDVQSARPDLDPRDRQAHLKWQNAWSLVLDPNPGPLSDPFRDLDGVRVVSESGAKLRRGLLA
jgi:hypothetical protein